MMRAGGRDAYGDRLRAIIVVLWRAGLRVGEALLSPRPILILPAGPCWSAPGRTANAARSAWTRGGGARLTRGSSIAASCPSARCSASCMVPVAGDHGLRPRSAGSCAAPAPEQGYAAAWRPTNSRMPTPWRWRMRGSQWWSSSASSGMPISASRAFICRGSTTRRSSTPSITVPRRLSRPAPACAPRDRVTGRQKPRPTTRETSRSLACREPPRPHGDRFVAGAASVAPAPSGASPVESNHATDRRGAAEIGRKREPPQSNRHRHADERIRREHTSATPGACRLLRPR